MTTSSRRGAASAVPAGAVALSALFVAALAIAQPTASKILAFRLPVALPVTGSELVLPGAALAYALTFLASDCYTELYGRRSAQVLVNIGFLMNLLVLALVYSTITAPAADPEFAATFEAALAPTANIIAGSLLAYVVSQNYDVVVFDALSNYTDGRRLWLRNVVSTGSSQAIDTVIFVGIAFWVLPRYAGVGGVAPEASIVLSLIVGQYLLKLLIALLDTPFVYLITGAVRRSESSGSGVLQ